MKNGEPRTRNDERNAASFILRSPFSVVHFSFFLIPGQWSLRYIVPGLLLVVLGCGGSAPGTRSGSPEGSARGDDPLDVEREVFRKASDAASFRDALQVINSHLSDSSALHEIKNKRGNALPPERMRQLLGLEPDEWEYLEASTFQPLDAHYLAEALELQEAARGLQSEGLPKLQQAELAFQWVMRQVILRGDSAELVPPHYVLLGGQGSAQERALVFLGLLQQLGINGCQVALRGGGQNPPRFWTVGVLIEDKAHSDIYLFDTRLGVPLPGPAGKGIATLAQLQTQPELLRQLTVDKGSSYDVVPEEVRTARVYLACSLSALAPRMKLLEDRLPSSGVRLSIDPAKLVNRLEAAAKGKVQAWESASKRTGLPPGTPVRALRRFVPAGEGGLDRTAKAQRYERSLRPLAAVETALRDLRLEDLPVPATQRLFYFADTLYMKYAATPRDNLVRGRLDEATRTLVQILSILREFDEARLPEGEFIADVAAWRERVKQAQIQVIRQVPDADKALEQLWYEDQHLHMLLAQAVDEREREKTPKKVLSFLVVRSVAAPLQSEASYLLALCWQEKAERVQTQRLRHARTTPDEERANAWLNVQDWWRKYVSMYPFSAASVNDRLKNVGSLQIRPGAPLVEVLERTDKFVSRWEWLFRDLRIGFQARILQAHGLEKAGNRDAARASLQSLVSDLDALPRDQELSHAVDAAVKRAASLRAAVGQAGGPEAFFRDAQARMADLQRDLGPGGSFAWMRASAFYRLRQLP